MQGCQTVGIGRLMMQLRGHIGMHGAVAQNRAMHIGARTLTQQANMGFVTRKIAAGHEVHGAKRTVTVQITRVRPT